MMREVLHVEKIQTMQQDPMFSPKVLKDIHKCFCGEYNDSNKPILFGANAALITKFHIDMYQTLESISSNENVELHEFDEGFDPAISTLMSQLILARVFSRGKKVQ